MTKKILTLSLLTGLVLCHMDQSVFAQGDPGVILGQNDSRVILTAVPFLGITPDARSAGLGDAGSALSGDANAVFWNVGRIARAEKDYGASLSVSPWLRSLGVTDVFLTNVNGFYKIRQQDAVSASLTYFGLGTIYLTDEVGNSNGTLNPNEFAFSGAYSRQLSRTLSVGVGTKFFYSNLVGSFSGTSGGDAANARPARSVAVDLGMYYTNDVALAGSPANVAFGVALSNFGPKISYTNGNRRDFIPTTLRVGGALTTELDPYNKVTFTADISKLLVPTPSLPGGPPPDSTLIGGLVSSLFQAPGGFKEKMQELMIGGGVEYWYDNLFALRGGYFHEHREKGNRKYFTAGVGIRYQTFGIDFAYLLPVQSNHPLAETLRFSLLFNFDKPKGEVESVLDDKK
jgi:hypothetical protein